MKRILVAMTGVLEGKSATTHWEDIADLRSQFPDVIVREGVRWVDEGSVVTSAGIAAGIDMSLHLVHKDAEGRLAVVAVLLDRGSAHPIVQSVWNNLPLEKHETLEAPVALDLNQLLPADRRYYTFMGSLTTPPCTEGVLWLVMQQPVMVSQEQIALFSRLYPMNARPIQSAQGRLIKQSN